MRAILTIGGRWILRLVSVLLALLVLWIGGSLVAAVMREGGPQPQPPAEGRLVPTEHGAMFAQIRGPETGQPAQWLPALLMTDRAALSADIGNYRLIGARTALIWGDKDQVTPLAQGQQLNRLIQNSRLNVLDNVGHIPHIEAPEGFYDVLLKELKFVAAR